MAARNLGGRINSRQLDYCPFIDWGSGNFYFTSERTDDTSVVIENLEALDQLTNHPWNGFGNIYRISLDQIEQLQ